MSMDDDLEGMIIRMKAQIEAQLKTFPEHYLASMQVFLKSKKDYSDLIITINMYEERIEK